MPAHVCLRKAAVASKPHYMRMHPEHVASSAAALVLLGTWSAKGSPPSWAVSVHSVGEQWLKAVLGQEVIALDFKLDRSAWVRPGFLPAGRHPLTLEMHSCMLQLGPLREAVGSIPLASALLQHMGGDDLPAAVPVWDILEQAIKGGQEWLWWLQQLVVLVALALDTVLVELPLTDNALDAGRSTGKRKRLDPALPEAVLAKHGGKGPAASNAVGAQVGMFGRWGHDHMRKQLVRYFLATREHFAEVTCFCVMADAARIGGRDTLMGAVLGRPASGGSWAAAWLPPQDRRPAAGKVPKHRPENAKKPPRK
eukprot:4966532-Lingulodinium_polyedra.AAC.1